ncbi:hypothetical protein [Spirillospora sp. CA-128828]|uniref:hypothetical protein n=1 Tax=Spirillospora sp. CA-128828 TaxID=3240033 RepID=UPI003D8C996A
MSGSKHRADWEEITELGYVVGKVCFNGSQKRTTVDSEPTSYVVNLDLFMKLCHRLAPIATR